MKFVKLHKFVCRHDKGQKCRTDIYVNPEKVTWLEEAFDDGKKHACIYFEGDDFVDVFEQLDDAMRILGAENAGTAESVPVEPILFKDCENLSKSDIKKIANGIISKNKEILEKKLSALDDKYGDIYEECENGKKTGETQNSKGRKIRKPRMRKISDRIATCETVEEVPEFSEKDKMQPVG